MRWLVTGTPNTPKEELPGETLGFLGSLSAAWIIKEWGPITDNGTIIKSSSTMADFLNKLGQNLNKCGKNNSSICCGMAAASYYKCISFLGRRFKR